MYNHFYLQASYGISVTIYTKVFVVVVVVIVFAQRLNFLWPCHVGSLPINEEQKRVGS